MCKQENRWNGVVTVEEVKKVEDFKYLGSKVQNNKPFGKEVKK